MKTKDNENTLFFYSLIILLAVYKFSFAGFLYTPYLDDYVQYLYYPNFSEPFKNILFGGAGTAFTRPLAALADIYLCLEVEDSILPYLNEGRVDLRFAELPEGYTLRGSIDDYESLTANDRYILVRIGIEEPLLNELRYGSAEVVGETISGVMIPKSSLVTDEQGNSGVYIKDRKKLAFCEVEVVGEGEDAVIVEGISATDIVAANPTHAKVGQKVY